MNKLLQRVVSGLVRTGHLSITGPNGQKHTFGDGTGDPVHIHIKTSRAERAIGLDPMLAAPEAYMDGDLDFLEGDTLDLLRVAFQNMGPGGIDAMWSKAIEGVRNAFRRLQQVNTTTRSRRNVQRHYDLSGELYKLFLDDDMQYSCAYFENPDVSLEEAQAAKKRHIAAKMRLKPGQNVLDIGSGWGGLGLYLAKTFEVDVLGVTLSTEQHGVATERAQAEGLENHVHFEIKDYRNISERFDRIVSVGMFEHVGLNHYRTFFDKCAQLLKPDGVMVLHSIGRSGVPYATSAVHPQIHLPRRLHPVAVGSAAVDREVGPGGHRHRDPAAALRRDAEALARSASSPTATRRRRSTTSASAGCGISTSPAPRRRSAGRT